MLGQQGTHCPYWQYTTGMTTTPQITQTLTFLQNNPGQVKLITLDIGVNDLLAILGQPPVTIQKVLATLAQVSTNLDTIYGDLQTATAGQNVPIVTMTYYNPFIVTQPISGITTLAVSLLNNVIINKAAAHNVLVAQVYSDPRFNGLFSPTNPGPAIQAICKATWICYKPHPDIHPTTQGYTDIAQDFSAVLPPGV
jgi:lysophospholipase L1-like esterase